ncbi:MAG: tRNA (guanosine(46)-N7)-methyltransferase TrmB [Epulopiscium sp.]|nr:tRNA (guanosine(46)-N7)-methyltransferase TrmB [Candidatus Epulonipiscium sp.]
MRVRRIPGASEQLQKSPYVIDAPEQYRGHWKQKVQSKMIHIELGMGRGRFIIEMAQKNPQVHYIGIEKYDSILIGALERLENREEPLISNLNFLNVDGERLEDIFEEGEVGRIYLNFSDPWPKERHKKRRLTHHRFLERYLKILSPVGDLHFKTDNKDLFLFSVEEFKSHMWTLNNVTHDLYQSDFLEGNIATEYERRFLSQGKPIFRLEAARPR